MAIPKVKATYSLDVETVRTLERLARRWEVSKSEALRRAIRDSAAAAGSTVNESVHAWDRVQESLGLTKTLAESWARRARAERRKSSKRRGQ